MGGQNLHYGNDYADGADFALKWASISNAATSSMHKMDRHETMMRVYLKSVTGSTSRRLRSARKPDRSAIVMVMAQDATSNLAGSMILAPTSPPTYAMPKTVGSATPMPAMPTQKDCASTIPAMRQRGIPNARSTAYSLRDATVAEYRV